MMNLWIENGHICNNKRYNEVKEINSRGQDIYITDDIVDGKFSNRKFEYTCKTNLSKLMWDGKDRRNWIEDKTNEFLKQH